MSRSVRLSPRPKVKGTGNDLSLDLKYTDTKAGAYPALLVTYEIVCSKGLAADKTAIVKDFLTYFSSTDDAEQAAGSWVRAASKRSAVEGQDCGRSDPVVTSPKGGSSRRRVRGDPPPIDAPNRKTMAVTDTDATERVEPEPVAAQDPSVSPVVDHSAAHVHSPVPTVAHHVRRHRRWRPLGRPNGRHAGVKLAKISRTGDRVFRGLATTSGLSDRSCSSFSSASSCLALALPSLRADQDNFLTSRNWTVAGNELRFGIAGLLLDHRVVVDPGDGHGRPGGDRRRSLPDAVSAQASLRPSFLRGRSAGRRTVDHLRPLGPDHFGPLSGPRSRVADRQARLDPAVQQECGPQGLSLRGRPWCWPS